MDSFFGIGAPELILILLLAGIVMGPQRISQVARWLGKTTAQLQAISRQFVRQLNTELAAADESGDLKGAIDDIQALRRQVNDLRQELKSAATKPITEGKTAVNEFQEMVTKSLTPANEPDNQKENRIAPPTLSSLPNLVEVPDDPE